MKRETLKKYIDDILIKQCGLESTYFSIKSDNGENIIINKEVLFDPLDAYEVLSIIEKKCNVLVDDEKVFKEDITYGEFIDIFYNEIEKEKMGLI